MRSLHSSASFIYALTNDIDFRLCRLSSGIWVTSEDKTIGGRLIIILVKSNVGRGWIQGYVTPKRLRTRTVDNYLPHAKEKQEALFCEQV